MTKKVEGGQKKDSFASVGMVCDVVHVAEHGVVVVVVVDVVGMMVTLTS